MTVRVKNLSNRDWERITEHGSDIAAHALESYAEHGRGAVIVHRERLGYLTADRLELDYEHQAFMASACSITGSTPTTRTRTSW